MGNPKVFISTSNFNKKYDNNLNDILKNGIKEFDSIEIASGHNTDESTYSIIKQKCSEGKRIIFHNYSFREKENLMLNLCEEDKEIRKKIIKYIKQMISLTKDMGEDYYSIHGGFYPRKLENKTQKKRYDDIYMESISEIVSFAEGQRVFIGVENHVVESQNIDKLYLYDEEQFVEMFSIIKSLYLKLHLDVGHLKVSSTTYKFSAAQFIKRFSNKIMTVHLHDNNGIIDEHKAFDISNYFFANLKELEDLRYIVIETWNQEISCLSKMIRMVEDVC